MFLLLCDWIYEIGQSSLTGMQTAVSPDPQDLKNTSTGVDAHPVEAVIKE